MDRPDTGGGELRFDGRVAIVTGAGGRPSLGRAYALLLASRGAKVVVNDIGVGIDGKGTFPTRAAEVAAEISSAGGEAIADSHSVADEHAAQAVVDTAVDAWGKVDILVNNAGVAVTSLLKDTASEDIRRTVDANLYGSIWMCRAVWPLMEAAGYGRIVNVGSDAVLGAAYLSVYGAAKAAVFGLTMSLAIEGQPSNITVNVVGPRAVSAHLKAQLNPREFEARKAWHPERVAPAVAFLAHERCPVTGRYLEVYGGRVHERFMSQTEGYVNPDLTIEDVRDNLDQVIDRSGALALSLDERFAALHSPRYSQAALVRNSRT